MYLWHRALKLSRQFLGVIRASGDVYSPVASIASLWTVLWKQAEGESSGFKALRQHLEDNYILS
jgi:hypothetical protein